MTGKEKFCQQMDVSRETLLRLETFEAILTKWNGAINLVSASSLQQIWTRHFLDSAQIFTLCPKAARVWVDIGSGGGLPGLVVAALAKESLPDLRVTLIESDTRKAAFLAAAARAMDVDVTIHAKRIEAVVPQNADVLSARALAPLSVLLEYAERHLSGDGICIFPKGAHWQDEITAAHAAWRFNYTAQPSLTEDNAVVLEIMGAQRV
ncbi:16S rRNA (guanine(527)-N(7))-methyltransferase RsmG [Paenirhodobacter sp.]|uniref:16S rRNA (guanine(527)-N(7))-methyltransferase RsmG n=1 Tax=Paenirhodobacter sp. TaxID=1965326 RepID=UPI003B3FA139